MTFTVAVVTLIFEVFPGLGKLILGRDVRGCRCAMSLCDLDLTFDLAVVTLTVKILSGLYLGNHKV